MRGRTGSASFAGQMEEGKAEGHRIGMRTSRVGVCSGEAERNVDGLERSEVLNQAFQSPQAQPSHLYRSLLRYLLSDDFLDLQ